MRELTEHQSKQRLNGIPTPDELLTTSIDDAVSFARSTASGRVVAKASGVAHKTEGGLVRLDLDATGVASCFGELARAGDGRVLVAEMVAFDLELIVGVSRDDTFGAVITIGAGGITAEAAPDVVAVLAPTLPGEIDVALQQLRIAPLLAGWRGAPPLDVEALGDIVDVLVRQLDDPAVVAVDCNPVAISAGRPVVLDALVIVEDESDGCDQGPGDKDDATAAAGRATVGLR